MELEKKVEKIMRNRDEERRDNAMERGDMGKRRK